MKKVLIPFLSAMLLMLAGCKKDKIVLPPDAPVPLIKSYKVHNNGVLTNVLQNEFDSKGRNTKQTFIDGDFQTYTYEKSKIIEEKFDKAAALQYRRIYSINADGLADSYFVEGQPLIVNYCEYDGGKNLISEIKKFKGTIAGEIYHSYYNGNKISDSIPLLSGAQVKTYEYYPNTISSIENINYGVGFWGAGNKNYIMLTTTRQINTGDVITKNNGPEYDAEGRLAKQTYTSGYNTSIYNFTYN